MDTVTSKPEIKDWYEHKYEPSIFIMFTRNYELVWCYSGNELRRGYLDAPDHYLSGPIEVEIPEYLDKILRAHYEDF